ncbi:MAG TPA: hypothetical protein VKA44_01120, partial [Gemmatimonadota bacterium]|nr:hypothetical protein [Gemmatimonadota bacterium]
MIHALRAELGKRLALREASRVPEGGAEVRAAVVLLVRAGPASEALADLEALFVQRAETEGDPWSGHMALPGGRSAPADEDLAETA